MLLKSPPPGETSPQATEGVHFPCGDPAEGLQVGRLVPGLHIKGLSNKSPDRCRRRGFTVLPLTGGIINSLPLKGKRLTTFCVSLTLLQNVFAVHRKAAIHNPRAIGPSNLKTLRPQGPVHLKNLFHNLFCNPSTQPAADRRPQPSARRAVNLSLHNPFIQPTAKPCPFAPKGAPLFIFPIDIPLQCVYTTF